MSRREFRKPVALGIIVRARLAAIAIGLDPLVSGPLCEKCEQATKHAFEIHHLREDGLEVDKSGALTAEDGALWCKPCHKEYTAKVSIPTIAKAKRREANHLGIKKKVTMRSAPKAPRSTSKLDSIRALGPSALGKAAE